MNDDRPKLNTKAAGVVGVAVLCSRVLGLIREILFAGLFGAGRAMDTFFIAFKAPNLLRDLFAEGALSTAFITVFSKKIQTEGPNAAWALASKMATLTVVFMSLVVILGVAFAEPIIGFLAPGWDDAKIADTVVLTRIMFPFILLVSLAALVMGMLNARNIFGVPAMASSFFNIGSIIGGVTFGYLIDPTFGPKALVGLAWGTLLGGLLQLCIQLPSLRKVGFRFVPDFRWKDPGVWKVLGIMLPSVIAASAVQVNVMVNAIFASFLEDGAVSWLQYAFRLMQLPIGIFGVAIATVTLPAVAKIAAGGDLVYFRETLSKAIRLAIFLTIPSAIGLVMLSEPIISLIYERGRFTWFETLRTAEALQFYALGLVGYSCVKVLSPAFYAIDKKWTPMVVSFGAIGLNIGLNYLFIFHLGMGHRGLALSTSISATANFAVLFLLMRKNLDGMETLRFVGGLARCLVAAAALGAVAWLGLDWGSEWLMESALWIRIPSVLGLIGLCGAVYLLVCWALRVGEIREGFEIFRKKFARRLGK